MPLDKRNLNDPDLYAPRETPKVSRAELRYELDAPGEDAPRVAEPYRYDEPEGWDTPLERLTVGERPSRRKPIDAGNPYAKPKKVGRRKKGGADGSGCHPVVYAAIIAVGLVLIAVISILMMPQVAGYFWKDLPNYAFINGELLCYDRDNVASYKQYRNYLQQDIIYPGVFVDGVHVGGMTIEQANAELSKTGDALVNDFSLTVNIGDKSWTINSSNVPAKRDLGNVLQRAYAIGRTNSIATLQANRTPFRERVDTVLDLRDNHVMLTTQASYDHDAVRAIVNEIAAYVTRAPVDSEISTFDFNTRTFGFTDAQVGVTIDAEALYTQITDKLDKWEPNAVLTVAPVVVQPTVTKADLEKNFKMIAAYTTTTTSSKNRNTNISLACQAINGTVLMPGETFSFNKATGERTTAKGYQSAGAIAAGQSIEEVGGGICQVSSTLFNAVVRADLQITSRSPHAWPSTYVNKGEDATVNWPNLDFKFTNNNSTPIFVIAYYSERKCSAEIWGLSLGDGVTIDLESTVVKTIEPSSDAKYVQNPELPYGESKETVKARTGYVVETYKIWYVNGVETKRELLHTSTYKAYQRTIEYN